jgi:hypothetical protein
MPVNTPEYQRAYYERNREKVKKQAAAANRRKRESHRQRVREYLLTHPCVDCGEPDPVVLEFDHRVPVEKSFSIGEKLGVTWRWEIIEAEIAKCDVRCANCHRRRTAQQRAAGEW